MSAGAQTENISNFQIRPDLKDKFRSSVVKELIHNALTEKLTGFVYSAEAGEEMTQAISDLIRNRLLDLNLPRYKFVVNIFIGEQRGEGVKVSARCLWDADTDNYASDVFLAETFFCAAVVFAIYYY
ncbi:dynein light chain Tctex-type protein 2B-like [Macrobrachium rosenbergii]|uniref:dynein light chain Tctex-type protein 2B-like n=1 Tax=Macrobrachium rosenbergii TaxID=79674 RepID=UPI0034D4AEC7